MNNLETQSGSARTQRIAVPGAQCGPRGFAQGGIVAGLLARSRPGPWAVTLRRPVPLETELEMREEPGGAVALHRAGELVAEALPAPLALEVPAAPDLEAVRAAASAFRGAPHHNPRCFGCGPARDPGDGLGLAPMPCAGFAGVASAWIPRTGGLEAGGLVPTEIVWAALDCPGAYAIAHPAIVLLGRITARIDRVPSAGERLRALGWPLGRHGRKLEAGTAIVDEAGLSIAVARSLWIELRAGDWDRLRS